ncbi:MAG: hypothetical protein KC457_12085, partial [Myxococcales bacterium]|nr:hypothetical protein [Myxococcales bacterium]
DLAGRSPLLFVQAGRLVLDTEAGPRWARGALRELPGSEDDFIVSKPLVERAIPARHLDQRGRSFDLYGRDGKLCSATVGELQVIAQYTGPTADDLFEYGYDYGDDDDDDDDDDVLEEEEPPEPSKAQILPKVWETQPHWLVADLVPNGDCDFDEVLWARDAQLPAPLLLTRSAQESIVTREYAKVFWASTALAENRDNYLTAYASLDDEERTYTDDWKTMVKSFPLVLVSWLDPHGRPLFVEYQFGGGEVCSAFNAYMEGINQITQDGFVEVDSDLRPVAIFDADLDGRFEFYYDIDLGSARVRSETLEMEASVDGDTYCPC